MAKRAPSSLRDSNSRSRSKSTMNEGVIARKLSEWTQVLVREREVEIGVASRVRCFVDFEEDAAGDRRCEEGVEREFWARE